MGCHFMLPLTPRTLLRNRSEDQRERWRGGVVDQRVARCASGKQQSQCQCHQTIDALEVRATDHQVPRSNCKADPQRCATPADAFVNRAFKGRVGRKPYGDITRFMRNLALSGNLEGITLPSTYRASAATSQK